MSDVVAIALIEFRSIAAGAFAADAIAKKASLELFEAGTVQPGKYLVLVGGSTAEVEECYRAGLHSGTPEVVDDVFLPDAHEDVVSGIKGARSKLAADSFLTLETDTMPAIVRAVDAAVKGSRVALAEIRLGDGLGGKGVATLQGELADVEAAGDIAAAALAGRSGTLCHSIVSRVHEVLANRMSQSSHFDGDQ